MITPPAIQSRDLAFLHWKPVIDQTFDIFSWSSGHDLSFLCECASQAKRICEVGSYHGKSLVCMALANENAFIDAVDQPQDERCWQILKINAAPFKDRAYLHRGTSSDWIAPFGEKYDFAFIDGGHLETDVTTDIGNLLPRMASGAIISGHDWRTDMNDGVNQAVIKAFGMPNTFENCWWTRVP